MNWYDKCGKAPWQPPAIVFKIVWPILYTLYFLLIILERDNTAVRNILLIGLVMNLCWVPLFSVNVSAALVLLVGMIIVGIKTMMMLYESNQTHAMLFAPYLAWICYAFTLNAYLAYNCVN